MINEEKVIMMTKLASYESGEGKKDISILNYFRNDYIGFQLLKSVISATISFLAIFAVYAFYNFENIMQDYGVISYVVYANRYNKAQKHLRTYYANLKRLASMYER